MLCIGGPRPVVLRGYSWLCTQGLNPGCDSCKANTLLVLSHWPLIMVSCYIFFCLAFDHIPHSWWNPREHVESGTEQGWPQGRLLTCWLLKLISVLFYGFKPRNHLYPGMKRCSLFSSRIFLLGFKFKCVIYPRYLYKGGK